MTTEYIFDNKAAKTQAFDEIVKILRDIDANPDNENYEIWVSGHSLGAAMASLVAFQLAGLEFERIRKPVKCVSFSSPLAGCEEFRAAFQVRTIWIVL